MECVRFLMSGGLGVTALVFVMIGEQHVTRDQYTAPVLRDQEANRLIVSGSFRGGELRLPLLTSVPTPRPLSPHVPSPPVRPGAAHTPSPGRCIE